MSNSSKLIPLRKVISAATVDTYSDAGRVEHRYMHWGARGLKKLVRESLRLPIVRVLLPVNKNLMTAPLPLNFDEEVFVGYIDKGVRVPIFINRDLVNDNSVTLIPPDNQCSSCHNDITLCQALSNSETINTITIEGVDYDEVIKKTVVGNGDYWLEKSTPFLDTSVYPNVVSFMASKELITNFDMASCGCIKNTNVNEIRIKNCAPDVHKCYYSGRDSNCTQTGGSYRVFEESGVIQLDRNFKKDQLYLEHTVCMPKINGEYMVPEVAFETLVAYVKFKSIENKSNVTISEKNWNLNMFINERSDMKRVMGRVKLSTILRSANTLPKFDITTD